MHFNSCLGLNMYYPTFLSKTKNVQKMTEMGRYMDISFKPARQVSEETAMHNSNAFLIGKLHLKQFSFLQWNTVFCLSVCF